MAEQIAGRNKRSGYWHDRLPLRHIGGDSCKQPGSGGDGCPCVDRNALGIGGITVDYGQPGIEGRAAPCVGAPVDGDGKDGARRRIEPLEGAAPGGIARDAPADVIATSRPPAGSMEKAERRWRKSASWRMRWTPGLAENGGFINTTVGCRPGR